ncbi:hypothetical protein NQ317_010236 [Molorchus minor]|uniref:Reverse transcriptase domain-containing protein n=1 Tax=Molorchus minor TaxID=1323400 RepID=A0ABQ9JJC8_9CUCU|nr:hypothetical protein NQ317_010236 [Molorchus minor]
MANIFNDFFANVGPELANKIRKPMTIPPPRRSAPQSIFIEPTNKIEVINTIKSLKLNKAPGLDEVRAETLKEIVEEISEPLCHLINLMIEKGSCPPEFKLSVIKPLFKNGDKTVTTNYRPISLISNFAKFRCDKRNNPNFNKLVINTNGRIIEINNTDTIKYLGIQIDEYLRWDKHINSVINTLRMLLYKFKYLSNILDLSHLKMLYYALVESRLSYGILGWGGVASSHLKKKNTLQKMYIKIIYKRNSTYPADALYSESNIHDLLQLYYLKIITYHFINKNKLEVIDHLYQTRSKCKKEFKINSACKTIGQRCYLYLSSRFCPCGTGKGPMCCTPWCGAGEYMPQGSYVDILVICTSGGNNSVFVVISSTPSMCRAFLLVSYKVLLAEWGLQNFGEGFEGTILVLNSDLLGDYPVKYLHVVLMQSDSPILPIDTALSYLSLVLT